MMLKLRIGRDSAARVTASLLWVVVMSVGATSLTGCGGSGVDLAPVEGMVTLDGQPVEKAGVLFTPEKAGTGPSASGTTDARGAFRLSTANRPGAPLGDHLVLITKTKRPEPPRLPDGRIDEQQMLQMPAAEVEHLVPVRYSNRADPQLRATVEPNVTNKFTFSLTTGADEVGAKVDKSASSEPSVN
jgi:hypothetical protein